MELYQLRTFLAVAEAGHLTRAAERLFTSQPAVSSQIRALEEELGVKLFERSLKGMTLTHEGATLRSQAKLIVDAARNFQHQADGLRREAAGELILGLNNRPEVLRLIQVLQTLTQQHPALTYRLVNGSSGVILQGLREGSLGAGFFEGTEAPSSVVVHPLREIELALVAPQSWAEEFRSNDWSVLERRPWVFVSEQCSYYRAIQRLSEAHGLRLQHRFEVNEDLTVLNLVADGLGMTITSRELVEEWPQRDRIHRLENYQARIPLNFGYLESRSNDPAIRAIRDAVFQVWPEAATADLVNP